MNNAEMETFQDAIGQAGRRVSEFLADGTDRTPEEIEEAVQEYDLPDPLDDRPVDDE